MYRSSFFYSTDCVLTNSVGFWSLWCWLVVIPTQVFTNPNKLQRIICMNGAWFPSRRHDFLQTLHHLAQFCFLLGSLGSIKIKDPAPQLRYDAANWSAFIAPPNVCGWWTQSPLASGRFPHGALVVFVSLHTSQSGSFGTCKEHGACQLDFLCLVPWIFREFWKFGWLFFGTHLHIIKCFSFGSTTVSRLFITYYIPKKYFSVVGSVI